MAVLNCVDCGGVRKPGLTRCVECLARRSEIRRLDNIERKARGQCVHCPNPLGKTKSGRPSLSRCTECLANLRKPGESR
jgi:hypothetical protein